MTFLSSKLDLNIKQLFFIFFLLPTLNLFCQSPGSIDNSFNVLEDGRYGNEEQFNGEVLTTLTAGENEIYIGGNFTLYNGFDRQRLVKIDTTGVLSPNFSIGSGFNEIVNILALQTDGKLIVGAIFLLITQYQ